MNLTRSEIIDALELCAQNKGKSCPNCPLYDYPNTVGDYCDKHLMKLAATAISEDERVVSDLVDNFTCCLLERDAKHNPDDVSEICELKDRVENLTLYLQEAFAICPDELAVLDERHPGLPGYAPPRECKSCKIDD